MFDLSASLARMDAAAARAVTASRLDRIIARHQREMAAERELDPVFQPAHTQEVSMSNTRTPIRQGDVFLRPISKVPANLKETPRDEHGRIVLAHGEHSGHAHAIRAAGVTSFRAETAHDDVARIDGVYANVDYITVGGSGASLNHELVSGVKAEHEPVALDGDYQVIQQREYAPDAVRRVAD